MRTSIATVSLGGALREKLEAAAAAGFDGVEIFEADILAHDGSPAEVGRMVRDLGLEIVAFQPFRDFEGLPEPQRGRAFDRARRKFALMNELGTENILICSSLAPAGLGGIDRAAEDLRELGEVAEGFGVTLGYEALAWGRHVSDYRDAWEIVRRADHPRVGVILDSFHILCRDLPVDAIRSIPADRITFVQLADAPRLDMELLQWSRHFRNFPGQGELAVDAFMRALLATGYDGWLSLEIFNDLFRMASPRRIALDGRRSLLSLMDDLEAPRLPPRAPCRGVEFIEFALDATQAASLETLLAALGFRRAGRHRTKEVERWTQGDINLVLNQDPDGFAHSHQLVHGSSVCAIGLRIDDAAAALERAAAMLAQPFHGAVGPGEMEIPALRGLGETLLYFTETRGALAAIWDVDFEPLETTGGDAGLTRIDHIAQVMPQEETLSWRLFYLALFDFDRTPRIDIADPAGIVESQALNAPDGSVRICLNASQSERTMASRFMAKYLGAGVQHIAFATEDIFATVEAMKSGGLEVLPIPNNYYDDLEARFGLDAALLERLKGMNILYDEDATGYYFQVYTPVFAERFFFEIVQRNSYEGFGAANAAIRLAAQSRSLAA